MTVVQHLEKTVVALSPTELAKFRSWFAEFVAANWDAQIKADAAAGKFDQMAAEALAEYHAGKAAQNYEALHRQPILEVFYS